MAVQDEINSVSNVDHSTMESQKPQQSSSLESFKATSSGMLVVGTVTVAFAIYLIQRGILTALGIVDALSGQSQGDYDGLGFSYGTVSLLGPPLLAFLCLALAVLIKSRQRIWLVYVNSGGQPDVPPWTIGSDGESVSRALCSWIRIVSGLPLVALLVHLAGGLRIMQMGVAEVLARRASGQIRQGGQGMMIPDPDVWIPVGIGMVVSCVLTIRRAWQLWRSRNEFNLNHDAQPDFASRS